MNSATQSETSIRQLLDRQAAAFRVAPYPSAKERRASLTCLLKTILQYQDELATAIDHDFGGRSRDEVLFSEIYVAVNAVRHARSHVKEWMQPRRRHVGWPLQPAEAWVLPQPLGVIGIIVPWNYPIFLSMAPLAGALAAGNRVMLKPSEFTPKTSALMEAMIASAFPPDLVTVVTGDADAGRAFSALPFDHLLFTGSTGVGHAVMQAASEHLTPVTLELGGKSPAIVAEDANLARAAADIAYGKLLNSGQTCIAPDYVLVAENLLRPFIAAYERSVRDYYPDAGYTSIINEKHFDRLHQCFDEAQARGVETISIGPPPSAPRSMVPSILVNPPDDLRIMREEIFGPILPVKTFAAIGDALRYINDRPRPLALYLFAHHRRTIDRVLHETISGGVCINDTLLHIAAEDLPFGGVGPSGMGHYHGREGFDTFSKLKPVFRRRWIGLGRSLRPPYGRLHALMRRFLIR